MKRYLNKSLFYQGDSKIIMPLLLLYLFSIIINNIAIKSYFEDDLLRRLYSINYGSAYLINTFVGILFLIFYLCIAYIISVGFFKRKKWTTLLSGPFSRMDIRKREFYLVLISASVYLISFIGIVIQKSYMYYEVIRYVDSFMIIILLDILRIISISIAVIGGLALLDSFFSNLYYMIASIIFIFIYMMGVLINYGNYITYYIESPYNQISGARVIINYLEGYYNNFENYIGTTIGVSIFFIVAGLICLFIGKKLTNKMLVENMNEGVIFNFPKKILEFMIVTFPGIILSQFIVELINERYFYYNLGENTRWKLLIIVTGVLTVISYMSLKVIKRKFKNKKDKYYKI